MQTLDITPKPRTVDDQVVGKVLRTLVEEFTLLEPECEIDSRNPALSNVLYASGPIHEVIVVFPCGLPWTVHIREAIRESGEARPGGVWVSARKGIGVVYL
jgi:hypothetical protein